MIYIIRSVIRIKQTFRFNIMSKIIASAQYFGKEKQYV